LGLKKNTGNGEKSSFFVMKNTAISELFSEMADVMEILGEDRFRINSYPR
jgi:hypothetical protein